jgi:hypothetical protein
MKTQEEIEQLAEKEMMGMEGRFGFVAGYEKCQEDMADKKYTEEDMLNCWNTVMVAMTNHNPIFFKDYINSLNKQD